QPAIAAISHADGRDTITDDFPKT
ncbi:MAG: hypothetical protein QOI46_3161, partial [Alphaproteobacteria bacterium]|nr:hypothetical protein [Alphaproteobacteria bacterium]